eukprot:scaffold1070_cov245-Pinguiococcus_pyrenoidosus.AAC.50
MGAGASATAKGAGVQLSKELPTKFGPESRAPSIGAEYLVVLKDACFGLEEGAELVLRIAYEALVFLDATAAKAPLQHFPYQAVVCWGSTSRIFQFKIFGSYFRRDRSDTLAVTVYTKEGVEIQNRLLQHVKVRTAPWDKLSRDPPVLMDDMEASAVSKDDFKVLTTELLRLRAEKGRAQTSDGFGDEVATAQLELVRQFGHGRKFVAKQGVELLAVIGEAAPFERIELAIFLYGRLLNPSSFQLLLNQFSDATDRRNILHRLKADAVGDEGNATINGIELHLNCEEGLGSKSSQAVSVFNGGFH